MLRTKYLWLIHLGVCATAVVVCLCTVAQPFLTAILGLQWLIALFTVSVVLTLLTLIPGPAMTAPLPQLGVWTISLALSGLAAWWAEAALDPLLGLGAASFNWSFYLWCLPLLGLYLLATALYQITRARARRPQPAAA